MKKRLLEVEHLKERLEEAKGDNCLLLERSLLLEEQVEKGRLRLRACGDTEVELIKCKRRLDDVLKVTHLPVHPLLSALFNAAPCNSYSMQRHAFFIKCSAIQFLCNKMLHTLYAMQYIESF